MEKKNAAPLLLPLSGHQKFPSQILHILHAFKASITSEFQRPSWKPACITWWFNRHNGKPLLPPKKSQGHSFLSSWRRLHEMRSFAGSIRNSACQENDHNSPTLPYAELMSDPTKRQIQRSKQSVLAPGKGTSHHSSENILIVEKLR